MYLVLRGCPFHALCALNYKPVVFGYCILKRKKFSEIVTWNGKGFYVIVGWICLFHHFFLSLPLFHCEYYVVYREGVVAQCN